MVSSSLSKSQMSDVAKKHSAAGPFGGFLFQLDLALLWLCQSQVGASIGIETLDDVTLRTGRTKVLGQSKLSYTRNLLSDQNPNLWKTLSIWLKLLAEESVDLETSEFHLISNFKIENGLVAALKQANTPAKLHSVAKQLRETANKLPNSCEQFGTEILARSPTVLSSFLSRVRIWDGTPSHPNDQLALFAQKLNLASTIAPQVIRGLRGWILEQVEAKFAEREPAWIDREAFCEESHRLIAIYFDRRIVLRAAEEIDVADAASRLNRNATFIQQLQWIDIQSEEILDAIYDYLRSGEERIRLADENNITQRVFGVFENNLITKWKNVHRSAGDQHSTDAKMAGRVALRSSLDHREMLDGEPTTEFYLTRGTYHKLANGKSAVLGWHPDFRKLLAEAKDLDENE
jgi:hypothetical protein